MNARLDAHSSEWALGPGLHRRHDEDMTMTTTFNTMLAGDLKDVHDRLHYGYGVTEQEVRAALTNALEHIMRMENRLAVLERRADEARAANTSEQ